MSSEETIFAPSSGPGKSAVAVIRVSGPDAATVLGQMVDGQVVPRRAVLRGLKDPGSGELLDKALVLWFPGPDSFTGDDVVELHVHGGAAVTAAVLKALGGMERFRPAEAGEFTRRAFEAGRLDLSGVEGLADLINAQTDAQRRLALRDAVGGVSTKCDQWLERLLHCLAMVEANIDFADERDVPEDLLSERLPGLLEMKREMETWLSDSQRSEVLRAGFRVAIAGVPNVGKSSLLNAIAGRQAAIVTEVAGTTRDVVEVFMDMAGFPVVLSDTAGLRESSDAVELIGMDRARAALEAADLVVWMCDERGIWPEGVVPEDAERTLWVRNKMDLPGKSRDSRGDGLMWVSTLTGAGVGELIGRVESCAERYLSGGESVGLARSRQVSCLKRCVSALSEALEIAERGAGDHELVAECLRAALSALGQLSGTVDAENVLDVVFGEFCIGK